MLSEQQSVVLHKNGLSFDRGQCRALYTSKDTTDTSKIDIFIAQISDGQVVDFFRLGIETFGE